LWPRRRKKKKEALCDNADGLGTSPSRLEQEAYSYIPAYDRVSPLLSLSLSLRLWELLVMGVGLPVCCLCFNECTCLSLSSPRSLTFLGKEGADMYEVALKFVEKLVSKSKDYINFSCSSPFIPPHSLPRKMLHALFHSYSYTHYKDDFPIPINISRTLKIK